MSDPLVSILLPIQDPPSHLREAVTSAARQTFWSFEVIVSISPSAYLPWIEKLVDAVDERVRSYVADRDSDSGALIRMAAAQARGRYLAWLEGDDTLDPRRFELQMAALAELDRPAVATCGLRTRDQQSLPAADRSDLPAIEDNPVRILQSFLEGSRNPATLVVPRSCFDEVSGFDPSYKLEYDLDLAARLAARLPFVHVPRNLIRRAAIPRRKSELREKEKQRAWAGILERESSSTSVLAELASALALDLRTVIPALQDRVATLVNEEELTVIVRRQRDAGEPDYQDVLRRLGVPSAGCLPGLASASELELIAAAAASSLSKWLMLVDSASMRRPDVLAEQLVHAEAEDLHACLPVYDPLIHEPSAPPCAIAGTLFRRDAVNEIKWDAIRSEYAFWMAISRDGRIGSLPAKQGIARRDLANPVVTSRLSPSELARAFVDPEWYVSKYPHIAAAGLDPAEHYISRGWRERCDPNPWFSSVWYIEQVPEVLQTDTCPVTHFITNKAAVNLVSRPGFDLRWHIHSTAASDGTPEQLLLFLLPGLAGALDRTKLSPTQAWKDIGSLAPQLACLIESLLTHDLPDFEMVISLVDCDWYRSEYTDVASKNIHPVGHYLCNGWREDREPNAWFKTKWYVDLNPEAIRFGRSPLDHFIRHGAAAGGRPHPNFHLAWYARRYLPGTSLGPEVLRHFLTTGEKEGAVPDPRLDRADVHQVLQSLKPRNRPAKIRELRSQLVDEQEILSNLIDREWYLRTYSDISQTNADPVSHYLQHGWRERRNPDPWFDTAWYLAQDPGVEKLDLCPLVHFVRIGAAEGLRPSAGFDTAWYARHYLGEDSPNAAALLHFLDIGLSIGNVPDPLLDRPEIHKQVSAAPLHERTRLLRRLRLIAEAEEQLIASLVDAVWYRSTYPDNGAALEHASSEYRRRGWRKGRNPSPWFDTKWYLAQNPDAHRPGISPLDHFVRTGAREGRPPHPLFNLAWYTRRYLNGAPLSAEALLHFMTIGLNNGGVPDPRLATEAVQKRLLDVEVTERPALIARLLELLSAPEKQHAFAEADARLWPILLTRTFPCDALAVLLLSDGASKLSVVQAEAAAMAISVEDAALFGSIVSRTELRLSDRPDSEGISVSFRLPKQDDALRKLLAALPCRRAAAIGSDLLDAPIVRAVRNAGVPVFTNGPAASNLESVPMPDEGR